MATSFPNSGSAGPTLGQDAQCHMTSANWYTECSTSKMVTLKYEDYHAWSKCNISYDA